MSNAELSTFFSKLLLPQHSPPSVTAPHWPSFPIQKLPSHPRSSLLSFISIYEYKFLSTTQTSVPRQSEGQVGRWGHLITVLPTHLMSCVWFWAWRKWLHDVTLQHFTPSVTKPAWAVHNGSIRTLKKCSESQCEGRRAFDSGRRAETVLMPAQLQLVQDAGGSPSLSNTALGRKDHGQLLSHGQLRLPLPGTPRTRSGKCLSPGTFAASLPLAPADFLQSWKEANDSVSLSPSPRPCLLYFFL